MSSSPVGRTTNALAQILNSANQLDGTRISLLTLIPTFSDDEIIETRMTAQIASAWAWIVECACDREMFRREKARTGRGNKDLNEAGRVAMARKQAYLHGVGASTLYRNAQIYNAFEQTILSGQNSLLDKGFFQEALKAPDPDEAIELFAQKKADNPFYSPADARRDVKAIIRRVYERKNELAATADDADAKRRKSLRDLFSMVRLDLEKWKDKCDKIDASISSKLLGQWVQEIIDQDEEWEFKDLAPAVERLWRKGLKRTDQIATGLALPYSTVKKLMRQLELDGIYEEVEQRGTDEARGKPQPIWNLVGQPVFD